MITEKTEYLVVTTEVVDSVVTTNDNGSIVLVSPTSSIVLEKESGNIVVENTKETVLITGLVGPQGPAGVPEEEVPYSKRVDFVTDSELYKGEATTGSAETSAVWRISKIVIGTDDDVTTTWADGNANFDNVWDDRLILSYS